MSLGDVGRDAVEQAVEHNVRVLRDMGGPGIGPGWPYEVFVVARFPPAGLVLLGGLGGFGCGQNWTNEEERHEGLPGYVGAPEVDSPWGMDLDAELVRELEARRKAGLL